MKPKIATYPRLAHGPIINNEAAQMHIDRRADRLDQMRNERQYSRPSPVDLGLDDAQPESEE